MSVLTVMREQLQDYAYERRLQLELLFLETGLSLVGVFPCVLVGLEHQ